MKNIQIIDSARNTAYSIYAASDADFKCLFPAVGQDIEFAEDAERRLKSKIDAIYERLWKRPVEKKTVAGIQGTLFFKLEYKKEYYPNKREDDLDANRSRPMIWQTDAVRDWSSRTATSIRKRR